jgi:hypothetical protein
VEASPSDSNPDEFHCSELLGSSGLALEHHPATFILVHGFKTGAFTGRKITDCIDRDRVGLVGARGCINGHDQAERVANHAEDFLRAP